MTDNNEPDIFEQALSEFMDKFEASRDPKLWEKLIEEESSEVLQAFADLLKEVCDMIYVTQGFLKVNTDENYNMPPSLDMKMRRCYAILEVVEYIVGPENAGEAFRRVHASNMSKLGSDGKPIRRSDGKIIKGPNYKAPDLIDLVI